MRNVKNLIRHISTDITSWLARTRVTMHVKTVMSYWFGLRNSCETSIVAHPKN